MTKKLLQLLLSTLMMFTMFSGNIIALADDEPTDIEEFKSMVISYKEEVEKLKLEVESLKDMVNAGRASADELCEKLERVISKYT